MESAISLKYQLLSVEAKEAKFSDYKDLGLVCKHCHQPVYLVSGRKVKNSQPRRTRSGEYKIFKPYQTNAYFAHFNSQSEERCRSNQQQSDRISRSVNRQQRLVLFEQKIESILALNPHLQNQQILLSLWQRSFARSSKRKNVNSYLRSSVAELRNNLPRIKAMASELIIPSIARDFSWLEYIHSDLELALHRQVVYEAIDYLLSDAGFRMAALVYQIAAIEACIYETLKYKLAKDLGADSLKLNQFLVHGSYYLVTEGIFAMSFPNEPDKRYRMLLEYPSQSSYFKPSVGQLQDAINSIKQLSINTALCCNIFAGIVALTPWKKGFEKNDSDRVSKIEALFLINSQKHGSYFLVESSNNILRFASFNHLDLSCWCRELFDALVENQGGVDRLQRNLPIPLAHLAVRVELKCLNLERVAYFSLILEEEIVVHIAVWKELSNYLASKRLPKISNKFAKFERELLIKSPTAIIVSTDNNKQHEHILLAVVNGFLCCWNDF